MTMLPAAVVAAGIAMAPVNSPPAEQARIVLPVAAAFASSTADAVAAPQPGGEPQDLSTTAPAGAEPEAPPAPEQSEVAAEDTGTPVEQSQAEGVPLTSTAAQEVDFLQVEEQRLFGVIKLPKDPLEDLNRISFDFSMLVDKYLLRPAALAYVKVVPKPARDGIRNFLNHLGEPMVMVNDLLQLKPIRALKTLGRFIINSVLGLGGLFDVAREKKFNLPHHSNSLANTLAFYGVPAGPYVYIPILGPTTLRDWFGRYDIQGKIFHIDNPVTRDGRQTVLTVLSGLHQRAENDQALQSILEDAVDPYATFRETWLQDRAGEVQRLKLAPDGVDPNSFETSPPDDPLIDPAAGTEAPADLAAENP